MKAYDAIKQRLEDHFWFRQRANKNLGIAKMLIGKYSLQIDPKTLEDIIVEASTLDRMWRQVQQQNPHLNGSDYNDKKKVEQNKMIELGYESGFTQKPLL